MGEEVRQSELRDGTAATHRREDTTTLRLVRRKTSTSGSPRLDQDPTRFRACLVDLHPTVRRPGGHLAALSSLPLQHRGRQLLRRAMHPPGHRTEVATGMLAFLTDCHPDSAEILSPAMHAALVS